jgi:hypothetical protein
MSVVVNIYVIRDNVAELCGPVFSCNNDRVALRYVVDLLQDVIDIDDFTLYCIAEFDANTMCVNACLREIDFKTYFYQEKYVKNKKKIDEVVVNEDL